MLLPWKCPLPVTWDRKGTADSCGQARELSGAGTIMPGGCGWGEWLGVRGRERDPSLHMQKPYLHLSCSEPGERRNTNISKAPVTGGMSGSSGQVVRTAPQGAHSKQEGE